MNENENELPDRTGQVWEDVESAPSAQGWVRVTLLVIGPPRQGRDGLAFGYEELVHPVLHLELGQAREWHERQPWEEVGCMRRLP